MAAILDFDIKCCSKSGFLPKFGKTKKKFRDPKNDRNHLKIAVHVRNTYIFFFAEAIFDNLFRKKDI
jgi:hypothetical protein